MTLLPRPSVSPLPSYAARPDFAPRPVSTMEALKAITAWLRGVGPDWRQRFREAQLVERLAEEMRQTEEIEAEAEQPKAGVDGPQA
jgi:hypothetical protein